MASTAMAMIPSTAQNNSNGTADTANVNGASNSPQPPPHHLLQHGNQPICLSSRKGVNLAPVRHECSPLGRPESLVLQNRRFLCSSSGLLAVSPLLSTSLLIPPKNTHRGGDLQNLLALPNTSTSFATASTTTSSPLLRPRRLRSASF